MKFFYIIQLFYFFSLFFNLNSAEKKNILLICVDDLRPELSCYGVDYIHSPNIDQLAARGRVFTRHYVQSPTCGASRYSLLTGRYGPDDNYALFARAEAMKSNDNIPDSMPAYFRKNGYTTLSLGKVSHHPGGLGGDDWNDKNIVEMPDSWDRVFNIDDLWQHPRGWMHGLANGEIREVRGKMSVIQSFATQDEHYPDGPLANEALKQLERLSYLSKPFFFALGFVRPHLPFGAPMKYMKYYRDIELPSIPHKEIPNWDSTYHQSGEFHNYNTWGKDPNTDEEFAIQVRKHYAACITYIDAQIGKVLRKLKEQKLDKNTIIVLWGDHGFQLGERGIWGKHALFEESLRSPLIISDPGMEKASLSTQHVVETVDIFPTLCELTQLPIPQYAHGQSLKKHLKDPFIPGGSAIAYRRGALTIRDQQYRLIHHPKGQVELYDFQSLYPGSYNVAAKNPKIVKLLKGKLDSAFSKSPQDSFKKK